MALTDVAIRNAKPCAKAYKLTDGAGMFLLVTPAGGKLWRLKYRIEGKEKLLAIGAYPETSLSDARKRREEARALIAQGKDPSREKQRDKVRSRIQATDTFTAIANEYCAKRRRDGEKGWSPATATRSEYLLSLLNGSIGRLAIADIEPADVLAAVRKIEAKGNLESARRTLQLASMVFRYAVATARLRSDPTRDLRGALTAPTVTHYGAITDAKGVGELLRAIDGYEGQGVTKLALQFAPHVFVRPGELRHAEWEEFDLDAGVWNIPAGKMKMGKAHHVPLSKQAVAILKQLYAATGPTGWPCMGLSTYMVFMHGASKPVSHISRTITSLSGSAGSRARLANSSRRRLLPTCGCQSLGSLADPVMTILIAPFSSSSECQPGRIATISL